MNLSKRIVIPKKTEKFKRWLSNSRPVLAIDTETEGLRWWRDKLRLLVVGDVRRSWVIQHPWAPGALESLARYKRPITFANAKFDLHVIEQIMPSFPGHRARDVQVMAGALRPNDRAALKVLGRRIDERADWIESWKDQLFKDRGWSWRTVPIDNEVYVAYAATDAYLTAHLDAELWPQVEASKPDRYIYELDWAANLVVKDMETRGARIDRAYCEGKVNDLNVWCDQELAALRDEYGIDPGSNPQLAAKLEELGAELTVFTEKGKPSVAADVLKEIDHPLARRVLQLRNRRHFAEAYFGAMLDNAGDGDLMHPGIKVKGARTGRMSVEDPPLQQLPRTKEVRDTVVPRDGHRLVLADFDQIEARLTAHYANDQSMLAMFGQPEDFFTLLARRIYKDPSINKDDPRRQKTKNVVYAKGYGAGPEKMAVTAGIPVGEAVEAYQMYEAEFPKVVDLSFDIQERGRKRRLEHGEAFVRTHYGRLEMLPEGSTKFYVLVNQLIQGTAADVFKHSIVRLHKAGLGEFMTLPVHDEIVCDVPEQDVDAVVEVIREEMPDMTTFRAPLTNDINVVERWGDKYN